MKKTIFIEILLLTVLAITIYFNFVYWNGIKDIKELIDSYSQSTNYDYTSVIQSFKQSLHTNTIYGVLTIISSICIFLTMVIIAIKDFAVFKPLINKLNANKQVRNETKAEAAKQARIEKLQAELEKLKKN